jgi:hypothetical protein
MSAQPPSPASPASSTLLDVLTAMRPFERIEDVVVGLQQIRRHVEPGRDRRGVFLDAYLLASLNVTSLVQAGYFEDNEWVSRYSAIFGDQYRQVMLDYERGAHSELPPAWSIALSRTNDPKLLMPQHLALGMNAHLGRDLPYAILGIGLDAERDRRYRDHCRINDGLRPAITQARRLLCKVYTPSLLGTTELLRPLIFGIGTWAFHRGREAAWRTGSAMVDAVDDVERGRVADHHEQRAVKRAGRILSLSKYVTPGLITRLRNAELPELALEMSAR